MTDPRDQPILTDTFSAASQFLPPADSVYIYRSSGEDRSDHIESWRGKVSGLRLVQVTDETQNDFSVAGHEVRYLLRSTESVLRLWSQIQRATHVYLDITGLTHPVWAAILRSAVTAHVDLSVVYVEPDRYTRSSAPVEGQIYDLSTRISGIAPLPGFARLSDRASRDFMFVAFLGFEGTRLSYLIEQVQPSVDQVVPVVGCPGFRPYYLFDAYSGNRRPLIETSAWHAMRFAPANCPFACFYLLQELAENNPRRTIKIAPIGTKPHALGAVLFAIAATHPTELVYDHPIRKPGRSSGSDRLLVYHVAALVSGSATAHGRMAIT
jgi:hypothetical protein